MNIPLEKLFSSKTRVKLLTLFLRNTGERYYVRELTRKLKERINSIRRELDNLVKIGLLQSEKKDQKKFYFIDTEFDLLPEFKALFVKATAAPKEQLSDQIKKLGKVTFACLSGSFTKSPSSVDLLIVGEVKKEKLNKLIAELEKEQGHEINFTVMDDNEYQYRTDLGDRFLKSIIANEKIDLVGKI